MSGAYTEQGLPFQGDRMTQHSFRDRVAAHFKAKPLVWIDAVTLEGIGGRQAWRTRVSDCRKQLGMDIRNRTRRMTDREGRQWTVSEYCFYPPKPIAEIETERQGHNVNEGFALRG